MEAVFVLLEKDPAVLAALKYLDKVLPLSFHP
jgi:hypothetical protein